MKIRLKILFAFAFLLTISLTAYGQEYLDGDKRFMKLTGASTDKSYGFDMENPIKVGRDERAVGAYLNSLKPLDGDRIHIGDMKFNYKKQSGLQMVVLTYEQKKSESTTLYFLTTEFEQPKAVMGFAFKTTDDIPKVIVFPADSIIRITACAEKIYSVEDFLVKEKLGAKPKPTTSPTFNGGPEELKKYFSANPLTDERVKETVFRVHIAFVVTCDGKAGNFQIVSKGTGDMATYANQVLAIVNRMPQQWQSATDGKKPVDCYQVLSFTVAGGQLNKVSYR